jgi:hypothetical protein
MEDTLRFNEPHPAFSCVPTDLAPVADEVHGPQLQWSERPPRDNVSASRLQTEKGDRSDTLA